MTSLRYKIQLKWLRPQAHKMTFGKNQRELLRAGGQNALPESLLEKTTSGTRERDSGLNQFFVQDGASA